MDTTVTHLEAQRNQATKDLWAAIKARPANPMMVHARALTLNRIDHQIAEERQSDASSADPLGVIG